MKQLLTELERFAGSKVGASREGTFGLVVKVSLEASTSLSRLELSNGLLVVHREVPGLGVFFGPDVLRDGALAKAVTRLVEWLGTQLDAELAEVGVVDAPAQAPRPRPIVFEGTLVSAPEAMLSTLPDVQEVHDALLEPYQLTGTPPPAFEDVWIVVVGLT